MLVCRSEQRVETTSYPEVPPWRRASRAVEASSAEVAAPEYHCQDRLRGPRARRRLVARTRGRAGRPEPVGRSRRRSDARATSADRHRSARASGPSTTTSSPTRTRRAGAPGARRRRGPRAADPLGHPFSERRPRTDFGAARARDGASDRVQGFDERIKASAGAEEPGGPRGRAQTAPSPRRAESCPSARARSPTPAAARPRPRTVPGGSAEAVAAAGRAASARGAAATTCRAAPAAESCPKWPSLGRLPRGCQRCDAGLLDRLKRVTTPRLDNCATTRKWHRYF